MPRLGVANLSPALLAGTALAAALVLVTGAASGGAGQGSDVAGTPSLDPRVPIQASQQEWVESTLAAMSLHERAGQVLGVRAASRYQPADARALRDIERLVADLALGSVVLFRSEAYAAVALVDRIQEAAAKAGVPPVFIAADFEWGADFRIDGANPYPTPMAVGATRDPEAARWMGRASARDARALGIHWIYAPVADVNVNPDNPVINVRAFGEDPEQVGAMAAAFIEGAQSGGVLATAKHFPGHGDTGVDSHLSLPILPHDRERLRSVELAPFAAAIDAGVASVMTAHMAVPALSTDPTVPATLSAEILDGVLREQLGFRGISVTDAMEMGGITTRYWSGEAAVAALAAGADVVLLPPHPRVAHAAIVAAVERGDLPAARLDEAVRRVLEYKARVGIRRMRALGSLESLPERFAPAAEVDDAQAVADAAVTLLRDRAELLPLDARVGQRVAVVGVSDNNDAPPTGALVSTLRASLPDVTAYAIDGRSRGDEVAAIVAGAARADVVVLALRVRVRTGSGRISLPSRQAGYARMVADVAAPTIVVALGSPYPIADFAGASTAVAAYGWSAPLQRAVARALTGQIPIGGLLPVTMPGLYPAGFGQNRSVLDATLQRPSATAAASTLDRPGAASPDLGEARRALRQWADEGAFPGAVYAVGHRNELIGFGAVGKMSWAAEASPMTTESLHDLASVTKVVATTTIAMMAVERGYLRLDYPVRSIVPEFGGEGREDVTIRHLLTHTSGLPAYVEYYRDYDPAASGSARRAEVLERIYATALEAPPGSAYTYSDLGIILLGEVLNRALGEPFHEFASREIFAPLGMRDTMWNPPASELERIPPTEEDPWRGELVHGVVHDENTHLIGGISTHAGVFSTAGDLAVFAQMLLNGGTYDHVRLLRRSTVESWSRRQGLVEDSSRALGWDTAHGSTNWSMFDATAIGHTGYTGTSIWIDPTRDLFVILLTNRVHPTRENRKHIQARIDFHRAVVDAVDAMSR